MATTYLSDTQATPTNNKKWTWSSWCKFSGTGEQYIMSAYTDANNATSIRFLDDTNRLDFQNYVSSSDAGRLKTTRYLRDPNAWYHIVCIFDSDNVTSGDRQQIWINGVRETVFDTETYPGSGAASILNASGIVAEVGRRSDNANMLNGELAHTYFCDGQAYPASTFGETDSTSGIWVAKASVSVTFGNNGFFLKYSSGASGTDSSGNSNDFAVSGTMTNLKDSPDNNFATMNPLDNYFANQTFTNTNNTVKSDHPAPAVGTIALTSGKWYFEGKAIVSTSGSDWQFGLVSKQRSASEQEIGNFPSEYSYRGSNGYIRTDNSETAYGATYTTGDIIGCAVDLTNLKLYFSKNGVWQDSGDPTSGATGTGAISITDPATISGQNQIEAYLPAAGADASANDYTWSMNFGNGYWGTASVGATNEDDAGIGVFAYDVPAGYYAICTDNLGDQS